MQLFSTLRWNFTSVWYRCKLEGIEGTNEIVSGQVWRSHWKWQKKQELVHYVTEQSVFLAKYFLWSTWNKQAFASSHLSVMKIPGQSTASGNDIFDVLHKLWTQNHDTDLLEEPQPSALNRWSENWLIYNTGLNQYSLGFITNHKQQDILMEALHQPSTQLQHKTSSCGIGPHHSLLNNLIRINQ